MIDASLSPEALALVSTPPSVTRIAVKDRDAWLSARSKDVTASVIGATMKCHEYTSLFDLWQVKTGRVEASIDETPAMQRGRLLEDDALEILASQNPDWRISPLNNRYYYRDQAARIGCTPDAFATAPGRPGFGILQIKTTSDIVWRRKWRPDEFGGEINVPTWIGLQALTEMKLTGASWCAVAVLVVGHGLDVHVVDVPVMDEVWDVARNAVADFWALVARGEMPDPDFERDAKQVVEHYAEKTGQIIDLTGDNRIIELVDLRGALKLIEANGAAAERDRKAVDAEIIAKLGHASGATLKDGRLISVKTITVNRKPAPASTYTYPKIDISGGAMPASVSAAKTPTNLFPEKF